MSYKKRLWIGLMVSAILLTVAVSPRLSDGARAQSGDQVAGGVIFYPGRLAGADGQPVADGVFDFAFALYNSETGGELLWKETQVGVAVREGSFSVQLGSVTPIQAGVLDGSSRWLTVSVRGPGDADFTEFPARQQLSAASPGAPSAGAACAHDHIGETWTAAIGWSNGAFKVTNSLNGPTIWGVNSGGGNAVRGDGYGTSVGVYGEGASGAGVAGRSTTGNGVEGYTPYSGKVGVYGKNEGGGIGVWGEGTGTGTGVYGSSETGNGVSGISDSIGVSGLSGKGYGVKGFSTEKNGVWAVGYGAGNTNAALKAENLMPTGNSIAAYFVNSSSGPTAEFDQGGSGAVLDLQNGGVADGTGGGNFIGAYSSTAGGTDLQFRVASDGGAWSDETFHSWGADFAEMLPAASGLEPGDVLIIGLDGKLTRSTQAYQASVLGVYSTQPGFVGGSPVEGDIAGTVPLAVIGVVPVKVSAENGAILPGDMLVASSIPGHAMKAGTNPPQGTVIGKALAAWDEGVGVILMLVVLQ